MNKLIFAVLCIFLIATTPLTYAVNIPIGLASSPTAYVRGILPNLDLGEAIIINVDHYEPYVLKQSLLQQQESPVAIYLKGTDVGKIFGSLQDPITGVSRIPPIKDIRFDLTQASRDRVSGVKYIPPKDNHFTLDNMGYLLVFLKKLKGNETVDKVVLDFNATIYFDLEQPSLIGLTTEALSLKVESEEQFLQKANKEENSFFGGKGYIIAKSASEDSAVFEVYDRDMSVISYIAPHLGSGSDLQSTRTLRLNKGGEPSPPLFFGIGGSPLTDFFRLKLDDIITLQDRATIKVSSGTREFTRTVVKRSPIFLGSNWIVENIFIDEKNGQKIIKLYLKNEITEDEEIITSTVFSGEIVGEIISSTEADLLETNYCPKESQEYICKSINAFKELIRSYGTSDDQEIKDRVFEAYNYLTAIYHSNLVDPLIKGYDKEKLFRYYKKNCIELFPQCKDDEREPQGNFGRAFLSDESVSVELIDGKIITEEEKGSVELEVEDSETKTYKIGDEIGGLDGKSIEKRGTRGFVWKVEEIYPSKVVLRQYYKQDNRFTAGEKVNLYVSKGKEYTDVPVRIDRGEGGATETRRVRLRQINYKMEILVSILPGYDSATSISSFRATIPIDPRGISFTPDELKKMIDSTQKTVDTLNNITDTMGTVVSGWKKACLGTFVVMLAKNLLAGGPRAIARRTVTEYYRTEKCKGLTSIERCYKENLQEMSQKIDETERAILAADYAYDAALKGKTPEGLIDELRSKVKGFFESGYTLEDYKEYSRLIILKERCDGNQDDYCGFIEQKLNSFTRRMEKGKQALAIINQLGISERTQEYEQIMNNIIYGTEGSTEMENLPIIHLGEGKIGIAKHVQGRLQLVILVPVTEYQYLMWKNNNVDEVKKIVGGKYNKRGDELNTFFNELAKLKIPYRDDESMYYYTEEGNIVSGLLKDNLINEDIIKLPSSSIGNIQLRTNYVKQTHEKTNQAGIIAEFTDDGYPYCYPTGNGNYVRVYYYRHGDVNVIEEFNVGPNGIIDCGKGDDILINGDSALKLPELKEKRVELERKVTGKYCKEDGQIMDEINKIPVICKKKSQEEISSLASPQCTDVMEPKDCLILANVCDPVMCPSSRCNLGGKAKVDNVISSGIIGSIVLCAPNIKEGIFVPVCLTGILAGLENIKSILEKHVECLKVSLDEGKEVGSCDYITSIGVCDMIVREGITLLKIKGGIVDFILEKLMGKIKGGSEYTNFYESFSNAENTFKYFTSEYKNTFLGYYKSRSTEDIGTEICRMRVAGKLPTMGEFIDQFAEPEMPPQFMAWFDVAPYIEHAGYLPLKGGGYNVKEMAEYKVFYHIYAGSGYMPLERESAFEVPTEVTYSVYLKGPNLSPLYVTTHPHEIGLRVAKLEKGKAIQQSIQVTAPLGYNEICIFINGKEECGFKKVSTGFAFNYLGDKLSEDEVKREAQTAEDCESTQQTSPTLGSITMPQEFGLISTTTTRICGINPPTQEVGRWSNVGTCGKDENGINLGDCWLDIRSVAIKNEETRERVISGLRREEVTPERKEGEYVLELEELGEFMEAIDDLIKSTMEEKNTNIIKRNLLILDSNFEIVIEYPDPEISSNALLQKGFIYFTLAMNVPEIEERTMAENKKKFIEVESELNCLGGTADIDKILTKVRLTREEYSDLSRKYTQELQNEISLASLKKCLPNYLDAEIEITCLERINVGGEEEEVELILKKYDLTLNQFIALRKAYYRYIEDYLQTIDCEKIIREYIQERGNELQNFIRATAEFKCFQEFLDSSPQAKSDSNFIESLHNEILDKYNFIEEEYALLFDSYSQGGEIQGEIDEYKKKRCTSLKKDWADKLQSLRELSQEDKKYIMAKAKLICYEDQFLGEARKRKMDILHLYDFTYPSYNSLDERYRDNPSYLQLIEQNIGEECDMWMIEWERSITEEELIDRYVRAESEIQCKTVENNEKPSGNVLKTLLLNHRLTEEQYNNLSRRFSETLADQIQALAHQRCPKLINPLNR